MNAASGARTRSGAGGPPARDGNGPRN
jgi:hypothetical protein